MARHVGRQRLSKQLRGHLHPARVGIGGAQLHEEVGAYPRGHVVRDADRRAENLAAAGIYARGTRKALPHRVGVLDARELDVVGIERRIVARIGPHLHRIAVADLLESRVPAEQAPPDRIIPPCRERVIDIEHDRTFGRRELPGRKRRGIRGFEVPAASIVDRLGLLLPVAEFHEGHGNRADAGVAQPRHPHLARQQPQRTARKGRVRRVLVDEVAAETGRQRERKRTEHRHVVGESLHAAQQRTSRHVVDRRGEESAETVDAVGIVRPHRRSAVHKERRGLENRRTVERLALHGERGDHRVDVAAPHGPRHQAVALDQHVGMHAPQADERIGAGEDHVERIAGLLSGEALAGVGALLDGRAEQHLAPQQRIGQFDVEFVALEHVEGHETPDRGHTLVLEELFIGGERFGRLRRPGRGLLFAAGRRSSSGKQRQAPGQQDGKKGQQGCR